MPVQHFTADQYPRVPWKNGLGVSRTIAQHPGGTGYDTMLWQVGATSIEADCPFSNHAGIDRLFMVIQGAGVALESVDAEGRAHGAEVRPGAMHRFQGDWRTHCRLLEGPVRVLNVLTRRGRFSAQCGYITAPRLQLARQPGETLLAVALDSLESWLASGPEAESCVMGGQAGPRRLVLIKFLGEEK